MGRARIHHQEGVVAAAAAFVMLDDNRVREEEVLLSRPVTSPYHDVKKHTYIHPNPIDLPLLM